MIFDMTFFYEESGKTYIEADSKEEAEQKLYKILDEEGIEDIGYKLTNREFGVTSCKQRND